MDIFSDSSLSQKLNQKLEQGGVISFVTDTVWGVGCLPNSQKGVQNIYELKNRDTSKPLILMSDNLENLLPYIKNVSPKAESLMQTYFPGALTLIFEKSDLTPDYVTSYQNTVGIRVPNNPVFQEICRNINGHVLATTSANLSGQNPALSYKEALKNVGANVDYVFEDYGYHCQGKASTVALINGNETKILRQGDVYIE